MATIAEQFIAACNDPANDEVLIWDFPGATQTYGVDMTSEVFFADGSYCHTRKEADGSYSGELLGPLPAEYRVAE